MKLLPTYATSDAGSSARNGYFDTETGIHYAVREARADKTVRDVCAYRDAGGDAVPMAYLSRDFETHEEALAELDRIAALIGGTAPAQGWVVGPPPKDGQWYAAIDFDGDPTVVRYSDYPHTSQPWLASTNFQYGHSSITHHQPTPIVLP